MATLFICSKLHGIQYAANAFLPAQGDYTAWTDQAFIYACKELCSRYELRLTRAFVPVPSQQAHRFSAHYAGLAGDFSLLCPCKNIAARQNEIRRWCVKSGLFSCVHPQYRTPLWIHAEVSISPPASLLVPYPVLLPGDIGVYCFVLQRCLELAGFRCLLSGRLEGDTLTALRQFRMKARLPACDIVDGPCWTNLMNPCSLSF